MKNILFAPLLAVMMIGCQKQDASTKTAQNAPHEPSNTHSSAQQQLPSSEKAAKMNFNSLIPEGYKLVASESGDLNGDGISDHLVLVEESHNSRSGAGNGEKRKLMIVLGDGNHGYSVSKTNDKIVPCKTCGGVSGDPFGYMRIGPGDAFKLVVEGGSSEHWSYEYEFQYSPSEKDWIPVRIEMEVMDGNSGVQKHKSVGQSDLGKMRFEQVDPGLLVVPTIE